MAFPTTGVLDAFTRANNNGLGADYAKGFNFGTAANRLGISSNQAAPVANPFGEDVHIVAAFGPDCEAFMTVVTPPATGGDFGLSCRHSGSGATAQGYRVTVFKLAGTDEVKVNKITNGSTQAQIGATVTQEFSAGDKLGMEVTGSNPTTINVYRQAAGSGTWDLVASVQDSSSPITATGNIGLYAFGSAARLDDFSGGTIASGPIIRTIDPVISTSALQNLIVAKLYTIDLVTSIDNAQSIDSDKHGKAHVILEFDTEQSLNLSKVVDLSAVTEADTEQALTLHRAVELDPAAGFGTAQSLVVTKTINKTLNIVQGTDDAQVVTFQQDISRILGPIVESGGVQALSIGTRTSLSVVTATELVVSLNKDKVLNVAGVNESNDSQVLSVTKAIHVTIDPVVEINVSQNVTYSQAGAFAIAPVIESDATESLTVTQTIHVSIDPVSETTNVPFVTYAQAGSTSITLVVATDTVLPLTFSQASDVEIQPAVSNENPMTLQFRQPSDFDIQPVMSTATVQGVTYKRTLAVTAVNEIGVARSFSGKTIYVIVPAEGATVVLPLTEFIQEGSYEGQGGNGVYNADSAATYEDAVGVSIRTSIYDD